MALLWKLTVEECRILCIDVCGQGGFQTLLRELQGLLTTQGTLSLSDERLGRIVRYACYIEGGGGFQGRLRKVFGRLLADAVGRL